MQERLYREYVTTSLRLIPEQKSLVKTYSELLDNMTQKTPAKSADEIAEEVITKAGLIVR